MGEEDKPVTVRFNVVDPSQLKKLPPLPPAPAMRPATPDERPLQIVQAKEGDPPSQPIRNTAVEALVEIMAPGVGENDTLGAPYAYDRALLRDFAERLIRSGVIRGELRREGVQFTDATDDVLRSMFAAICEFNMGMEDCEDETVLHQMREALKAANAMGWVLVPARYVGQVTSGD